MFFLSIMPVRLLEPLNPLSHTRRLNKVLSQKAKKIETRDEIEGERDRPVEKRASECFLRGEPTRGEGPRI